MNGKQVVLCWMVMFCACVLFDGVSGSNSKFTGLHPPSWTLSEIVTPVLLEQGDTHKGERHFQKRSATFSEQQEARSSGQSAQYRVEAFGEQFILDLDHDTSFLSPSFSVHVSGESNVDIHDEDNSIHCFYAGRVNGHPESSAVVSLCGGMFGLFHTHNGTQFYIEPEGGVSHGVETNTKPHIVYSSGSPSHPSSTPSPAGGCGVTGLIEKTKELSQDSLRKPTGSYDDSVKTSTSTTTSSTKPDGLAGQVYGLIQSIHNSLKWKESDTEDSNRPHHRGKRFISYERYLEMMVVADHKMVEHHGRGVQLYVLTLVAVVNRIFRDPSIGNAINVTLVELRILQNVNDGPHISSNAPMTLKNFCIWQQQQNQAEDSHPHHYDTAVLLTREDICRSGPDCDTLGLAELGTVCDPLRSCSIVEDNGLSAAFTMAHELGHVFNMLHDSNFKCQSEIMAGKYAVMAPTLNYHSSPWKWSKCSRNQLTEFLDLGYGECLLDKPTGPRPLPVSHPGEVYNITQQCELVFGTGSTLCTYMRTCKRLWCTGYSRGVQTGCRTQHMPWADGTPCGSHHWCSLGECREKDPYTEVIDGQWGKWGEYSECSRTCGGGVKEAMRNCDHPAPSNGGKYCIGRRLRFRSCNTQDCPEGSVDFREKQCSEFNGNNPPINGVPPNVRWVPKYEGVQLHDRCKLYCRVSHSSAYYELKKKVIDGTKCNPDTDDICVQGQCRQAGCDHVLSSNAKRDECGVCGGDNSSCRRERRTYNQVRHGYTKIITIPSGATQIEIKQYSFNDRAEDDNYLALSNDQDQFILNGNFIISMFAREIHINKTVLQYSGSSRVVETIISNDKLQRAINLYILSVGDLNPPNVTYSFNVPNANFPIYLWDRSGPWTECDRDCYGMKRRAIRCMDANDNRVVDDSMCEGPRPNDPIEEECNTRCIVRWHVMSESECDTECKKTRLIKCIKKKRKGEEYQQVSDVFCNAAERPSETVDCQDCRTSRYRWEYSLWSQCSRSCNTGTRSRGASCRYGEGYIVDNRYCDPSFLHTVEDCNTHGCPEWSALQWSACSVTCGVGEEHREVACYQEGTKVNTRLCASFTKPEARRRCEQQRCPHWAPGQWNSCSVTCGSGYQQRTVRCRTFDGQWLEESECSAGAKPITEQECNLPDCPIPTTTTVAPTTTEAPTPPSREIVTIPVFDEIVDRGNPGISPAARRRIFRSQWRTGAWTPCSMTCGPGIRERYVSCRDNYGNIDSADCDPDLRPPSMEMCAIKSCPHWRTGDWRECPVSCGEGVTTRYVACIYNDDTITSNGECDPNTKPSREHTCNSQDCPTSRPRGRTSHDNYDNRIGTRYSWRTSTWSSCSVSCGEGLRQRRVECLDDGNRISTYCDQNSRPPDTETCEVEACPSWDYGEWGQCSRSCGGGVKSRVVKCRRRDGQTVTDSWCDQRKPENSTHCNTHRCPARWHTGAYSTCSVSCGKGQKTRIVVCQYEDGSLAMDSECEGEEKPPTQRECKKPSCAKWKSGRWGECSVTCGRGVQEREVRCISKNRPVNETLCPGNVPRTSKGCRRPSCPIYRWKKGRWSQCNETCGGGVKLREVWCQDNKGRRVIDEYCRATRKKPTHKRKCNTDLCPPRYNSGAFWVEGLWGECTRTCGAGEQSREITCQALSEDGWRIPADYTSCNPSTRPESTRRCNMGTCFGDVHWKTSPWNSCSKSCGDGVQRRKVQCQARHGKIMPDRFCRHPAIKPETERICNSRPCPPTSCKDLQEIQNIQEDGDYSMLIQGRLLHIFCHGMAGSNPAEYLTLPASEAENYSEIYPKRLLNPSYCPNNGARNDDCECTNYGHRYPGLTSFNKIRINVTTLEIITDDPTFATVHHGHFIPYATAGDCFSVVHCPQGRFHLSLNGTGLVVAPDVNWSTEGHSVSRQISRDASNQRVSGICGGYCGKCFPDRGEGRLLPLTFQS